MLSVESTVWTYTQYSLLCLASFIQHLLRFIQLVVFLVDEEDDLA